MTPALHCLAQMKTLLVPRPGVLSRQRMRLAYRRKFSGNTHCWLARCLLVAIVLSSSAYRFQLTAAGSEPNTLSTNNSTSLTSSSASVLTAPTTPREFFNAGSEKLSAGKLREAEAFLESSLSSQIARLQPPALYNLGWVRYGQGSEELKKTPPAEVKKPKYPMRAGR